MDLMRDICMDSCYWGGLLTYDVDISDVELPQIEDEDYYGYYPMVYEFDGAHLINYYLARELSELVFSQVWDLQVEKMIRLFFKDSIPNDDTIQASVKSAIAQMEEDFCNYTQWKEDIENGLDVEDWC